MPIINYELVVGHPLDWALDDDASPHIEVLLDVAGEKVRAAINVGSTVAPHTLLYEKVEPFEHDIIESLDKLDSGIYDIGNDRSDLALDYPRDGMVDRESMSELPYRRDGPKNDLMDYLLPLIQTSIESEGTLFYLFGETWGPEDDTPDRYFDFQPGRGIHDIHMNQGSAGRFAGSNGRNQDGALVIRKPDGNWVGIFLSFTTQSWTNDELGTPLPPEASAPLTPPEASAPLTMSPIQIVAALINAYNPEEGRESVSLINVSDQSVMLKGWRLEDDKGRAHSLGGYDIGAGDVIRVRLVGSTMRLTNNSGKIQLIAPGDTVVQTVSYGVEQSREGWTARFKRDDACG